MNEQIIREFINQNLEVSLLIAAVLGFVVNQFFSKKALIIAKRKELFAEVNHRSSHVTPIPAFGGISLFVVFICAALTMLGIGSSHSIGFVVLSAFILFMSGLKDDLMGTSARTKLQVQLGTACLVLLNSELTVTHLSGFFGIGEVTPVAGFLISLGFIVFLVNAYNLIDGIDGLAGIIAIIAFSVFGVYYYVNDNSFLVVIIASMIGALVSFLTWNFASSKRKMFMGDTGSLVIGFILAVNALIIIAGQPVNPEPFFFPQNAVIFILTILVIPVLDTLRIIVIRLSNSQKPWVADRNHMHHLLLDKGLSHKQSTFCLASLQVIAIIGYIGINNLGPIAQHLFVLCLYSTYATMFFSASVTRKMGKNGRGFQKLSSVLRTLLP
jgi:UDP-N-acetylmuramyl pentapeptide phosphotransferase/UDP-N-acetylglucosamine-1-phosphate transferase